MDVFLLIVTIVLSLLLIVINFYILARYSHQRDTSFGKSWFTKIIFIFALMLSQSQVLVLPLDVANARGDDGMRIDIFWQIIYILILVMLSVVLPITLFYYQSQDPESGKKSCCYAIKYEIFLIIIIALILGISFAFLSKADIPVEVIKCSVLVAQNATDSVSPNCTSSSSSIQMPVSFPIYVMGLTSFVGWFFFILFAGVGLSALPLDYILEFKYRPRRLPQQQYEGIKAKMEKTTKELINQGNTLKQEQKQVTKKRGFSGMRAKRNFKNSYRKFQTEVFSMQKDYQLLEKHNNIKKIEPLIYVLKLILGIFLAIISFLWILHIVLFNLIVINGKPASPFFNDILNKIESSSVAFIATAIFGGLSLYLLFAAIKGNIKFGVRCFCFTFFPVRPNQTYMNSLLVNVMLINLWTVSLIQFCSTAFSSFVRFTQISLIYNVQIRYMKFFKWFFSYNVFLYLLLIWSILTMIYLIFKPRQKSQLIDLLTRDKKKNKG